MKRILAFTDLNRTAFLLPAEPHPVMTGTERGYPGPEHDTPHCFGGIQ